MKDKVIMNDQIGIGEGLEVDRWQINTDHLLTKEQEQRFDDKYNSFELCDTVCKQDSDRLKQHLADEIARAVKEERERIIKYVGESLALLNIKHGQSEMIGSWINKEDLLEKLKQKEL